MKCQLCILKHDELPDWSMGQRLRFAVVNLDGGKDYPLNFVCLLPRRLNFKGSKLTEFEKLFGSESVEIARKLLTEALETERDEEVKDEIDLRLKFLDPELTRRRICPSCGKSFLGNSKKTWKKSFCAECGKKRFGYRPVPR